MRLPRGQSPSDDSRPERAVNQAAGMRDEHVELRSNVHGDADSNSSGNSKAKHTPGVDDGSSGESECRETDDELTTELEGLALAQQAPPQDSLGHNLPHLQNVRRSSDGQMISADLYDATPRSTPSPSQQFEGHRATAETVTNSNGPIETNDEDVQKLPDIESLSLDQDRSEYDTRKELLPREPYFNKGFQTALKLGTVVASDLAKSLTHCVQATITGSDLNRLRVTATSLQDYRSTATRTIGIVGDSAAGKSSLINSLLNIRNLAHKGDWGSAVTSFVTEYRYRLRHHSAPYTIEVEYCTDTEIDEQLRELLISYRDRWRPGLEQELNESEEEFQTIEKRSEVALATLESIFGQVPEIDSQRLREFTDGALEGLHEDLKHLARGLRWPDGAENGRWATTAVDAEECQEKVGIFMENGLWPLTNIVRIFLSAQVLKSGIILADLPGYRDINLARVKKAQQYLVQCDEIFIVAHINRVLTDQSVKELLRAQLRSDAERNKSIAIVCTHADASNPQTKNPLDIDLTNAAKRYSRVTKMASTKAAWNNKVGAYSKNPALYLEAGVKYKYIYITARNRDISSKLASKYPQLAGNGRSNIFCVGNDDYEGNELHPGSSAHRFAISGSGVPDLRRFCHSVAAKAQFRASDHFLAVDIPSLIQSLDVWLDGSQRTTISEIPANCVPDLQKSIETMLGEYRKNLIKHVQDQILQATSGDRERALSQEAIDVSRSWANTHWHWASYKAWVRNNGTHYTQTQGYKCWNTELLYQMSKNLPERWENLAKWVGASFTSLTSSIETEFKELFRKLRGSHVPETMIGLLKLKEQDLHYKFNEEAEKLARAIGTCRYNSTGTHLSSYALETMIPIYRDCNAEHGPGMKNRMYGIMATNMNNRPVFKHIHIQTEAYMLAHTAIMHVAASEKLSSVCQDIQELLGASKGPESEASRSNAEDLERVRAAVAAARTKLKDIEKEAMGARDEARALGY